jgi:plasmid replication initiation protein
MVTDIPNQDSLLPDRHPQMALFVCDIADAVIKDDMASMEHPVFTLATKPDLQIRKYEHGEKWLEVTPSVKGLATIYDKDILIFAISQLIAAKNAGRPISRKISISARELLIFTNRYTGGRDYQLLEDSMARLGGTRLRTNIKTAGQEVIFEFGLVESSAVVRDRKSNRITHLELVLSEWLFSAIEAQEVLTLNRDYFRLRKPIERRIYEIARKHCGAQDEWRISLALLRTKCGSNSPLKQFRYIVKGITESNHLPDYSVAFGDDDMVVFSNRRVKEEIKQVTGHIKLQADTYHDARQVAPTWDVYVLEERWRAWMADGDMDTPKSPDKAFLGFCRKWFERNGRNGY